MRPLSAMFNYLYQKPQVGTIAGVCSGLLYKAQQFVTDENNLKVAAGIAGMASCAIAVITVLIQFIRLYDFISKRFKRLKP